MKYSAIYATDSALTSKILDAYRHLIISDAYYAMYGGGGTGTVSMSSSDGSWDDYYTSQLINGRFSSLKELASAITIESIFDKSVGWTTNTGNSAHLTLLEGDRVLIELKGRRHGIPTFLQEIFEHLTPITILEYDSYRTDQPPWTVGLMPTNKPSELVQHALKVNDNCNSLPDWLTLDVIRAVRKKGYTKEACALTKRI